MTPNPDWMVQAECRDIPNPEIFFPRPSETADAAKAVCARCPVRADCLRDAFEEIRRLNSLGWSIEAVCTALGVSKAVVHRANSRRAAGDAA